MSQLKIEVHQRGKQVFESGAKAVSAVNEVGEFDVLFNHAHMVTTIKKKLVLRYGKGRDREYEVKEGILAVEDNVVKVFLGI